MAKNKNRKQASRRTSSRPSAAAEQAEAAPRRRPSPEQVAGAGQPGGRRPQGKQQRFGHN